MPNAYLSGSDFFGVTVSSVEEALTQIRDFATANGWAVHSGSPSSLPMVLRCELNVGGIKPFYRFSSPAAGEIQIQMDLDGSGSSLSQGNVNKFTSIGVGSRIWIASYENQFLAVYVKPAAADSKVIGFGWPRERFDPNYSYSWILWNFDTNVTTSNLYANKRVARQYNSSAQFSICNGNTAGQSSLVDRNVFTGSDSVFNVAAAGSKPVLTPIPVFDSDNNPHGFVPLLVNGLCGAAAGSVATDPDTGIKYLCTGTGNHAFQISD